MAGAMLVPTAVRGALAPVLGNAVPFATFYPTVLVVGLCAGWRVGLVVTVLAAVATNYLFVPPYGGILVNPATITATVVFLVTSALIIVITATLRRTVRELDRALHRETSLRLELAHRVKNNLAVVQGLARRTAQVSPEPRAFYESLSGRLAALGQAHNVLSRGEWETCAVPGLIREAVGPFQSEDRIALRGEPCEIPPNACVPLILALHELGTNATKYGSLSAPHGRVEIAWRVEGRGRASVLVITWQESGGPPVSPPTRQGLGSKLLRPQTGLRDVRVNFLPDGVRCDVEIEGARKVES